MSFTTGYVHRATAFHGWQFHRDSHAKLSRYATPRAPEQSERQSRTVRKGIDGHVKALKIEHDSQLTRPL